MDNDLDKVKEPGTDITVYDPGADAGAGMEDVTRDEYAIPFFIILDPKSRFLKPVEAGGIPGAKSGDLLNTGTNEVFDGKTGVDFIPVARDHHFVEWIPKNQDGSGGGFVGIRAVDDPLVLGLRSKHGQFGKLPTSDNHELVETYYLYGLVVVDGTATPVLLGFSSTQIKKYRTFMGRATSFQYEVVDQATGKTKTVKPAIFGHMWHLATVWEKKGKAYEGYGWRITLREEPYIKSRLKTTDPLYIQAREFHASVKAGRVVVKHERVPGEDEEIPM